MVSVAICNKRSNKMKSISTKLLPYFLILLGLLMLLILGMPILAGFVLLIGIVMTLNRI